MPPARRPRILLVSSDGEASRSQVADDLESALDCETIVRPPATAVEFLRELGPTIDCVVCCAAEECDAAALEEAGMSIPVVVYGDEPPTAPVDGVVARDGGTSTLAAHVRDRIERERKRDRLAETNAKLTALAGFASEITACETADEVYERIGEVVTEALAFDKYILGLIGPDEKLYPRSADATAGPLDVDEGIAGRTYRTGEPQIVSDVREDPDARQVPDATETCLSVPVGEHGVIQVGRAPAHNYDERDVEFLQIIASHAAEALSRIRREVELRVERDRLHAFFHGICSPAVYVESSGEEEPTVQEVNPAYERFFETNPAGEPISEAFPSDAERSLFGEHLRSNDVVRREVSRHTARGEKTFDLGLVPVSSAGPDGGAYGLYAVNVEDDE